MKKILFSILIIVFFFGCGHSNSNKKETDNQKPILQETSTEMYFIDSPVEGLKYKINNSQIKYTSKNGLILCNKNDKISFFIGNTKLGNEILCGYKKYITPTDIVENQTKLKNTVALIQSLDDDDNPNNGITISPITNKNLQMIDLNLDNTSELNSSLKMIGKQLISPKRAYDLFLDNLFLLKTNNYNLNKQFIINFINRKISLIENSNNNTEEVNNTIKNIFSDYKNELRSLQLFREIANNEFGNSLDEDKFNNYLKLTNETLNLFREILLKEIFNIDSNNLQKAVQFMNNGTLNSNIIINNTPIDSYALEFLKDLNSSIINNEYNFNYNEISSLQQYYDNLTITQDELEVAKKYLIFYFISSDKTDLIKNVNKFYNTDLKITDDVLQFIANKYNYSINENNVKNFINDFVKYNQNIFSLIKEFETNIAQINDEIDKYNYNLKTQFTVDNILAYIESKIIKPNFTYEILNKNSVKSFKDINSSDDFINFDIDRNGTIYLLSKYGNIYKNHNIILKDKNAKQVVIGETNIYLLDVNGTIEVFNKKSLTKLYDLNNNIIYNQIKLKNNMLFGLRIDGKVDIYKNNQLINTLSDSKGLLYINQWISDKYAVFATNNGNIAIYNFEGENLEFNGYYNINPDVATIYQNKLFITQHNAVKYIDLDSKTIISTIELDNISNHISNICYDNKNNFLIIKAYQDFYLIKINKNILEFTTAKYEYLNTDIDVFPINEIKYFNDKVFYLYYGNINFLHIPTKPITKEKGVLVNIPLENAVFDTDFFRYNGNGMQLMKEYSSLYQNGIIFIPVKNWAEKIGLFIKKYNKYYFITLNNYCGMPDFNALTFNDKYILLSNSGNAIEFEYNPFISQKNFLSVKKYIPIVLSLNKELDAYLDPLFAHSLVFPDLYGNIFVSQGVGYFPLEYQNDKILIPAHFSDNTANVSPIFLTQNNNDIILWRPYNTFHQMGGNNIIIFKNFIINNNNLFDRTNNFIGISSTSFNDLINDFYIYKGFFIQENKVYNLYSKKLLLNFDYPITDFKQFGKYNLVLHNKKIYVYDNNFIQKQLIDVNNSYIKIIGNGYFLTSQKLIQERKSNNISIDIIPNNSQFKNTLVFDSNNLNDIAKIEINSSYPYIINLSDNNFIIENDILKLKNIDNTNLIYNLYIEIKDIFGNWINKKIKLYNLDYLTSENATYTYSKSLNFYQHDLSSITTIPFKIYKVEYIDPELTIKNGNLYLTNPDNCPVGNYSVDLIGVYNDSIYEYKINVNVKATNNRFEFTDLEVIDKLKNIIWTRDIVAEKVYSFEEAKNKCKNGWRLPTIDELQSIADNNSSSGYASGFEGPGKTSFWSQTQCDYNGEEGIYMFDYGSEKKVCKPLDQSNETYKPLNAIRCVKDN